MPSSISADGPQGAKTALDAFAREAGFAKMRVTTPGSVPALPERLREFLDEGRHGQMAWMAERTHWRADPAALWPEARSVIMLADLYTPEGDPLAALERRDHAAVSVYAQGRDYHDLVKKRLKRVGRWLLEQHPDHQIKVFVDTAPVMEKPLAEAAGLGWQGKHTNLLARDLGSWFFLGAIFTTVPLPPDAPDVSHCGSCRACLDICPTGAFPAPYQLDARRCISYLTIEHHGPVDPELRALMGNRIYGCDDCLAVCPWNKFAQAGTEMRYRGIIDAPPLAELAVLDDAGFRARFSGSPIKRIGRNRFVRNVLYAIGNSDDPSLRAVAQGLAHDPDETVADAARWAAMRLDHSRKSSPSSVS
ncbi:tRNA epoxyqueuosine(34) reductase QueG [Paracoccus sp. 1_MG-2023]|uniref:tRNA epoxyqueuosine(34) reductase QueG n=1 Tax=unclassified Paracoccus (in: a-proteobacteria) TaxID=2688777 RepID=UPI001C0910C9|nr:MULTISPECIES: tRNA epoxyqueuosine(34) reductase QueG [unclassified Paracoccus (in: a-proteobacteria)]MBU2956247.1 tRNA epoxyqueuosine(34) reductase QueG [Paracoccus sp. C2R09]MDO6667924.1 tRNA epoxyqueuosine(34) reductase QueG [Paracoccus sp. 1_MG-2023]